ncbi:polysaccharide deacetylase family protein [Lachnospiraceae bacterium 62-35]
MVLKTAYIERSTPSRYFIKEITMKKRQAFFTGLIFIFFAAALFLKRDLTAVFISESQDIPINTFSQNQEHKFIALTFDDGPHPIYTPELLDGLASRDVKASFFVIGKNIQGNEEIVKRIAEEGHLIGNHTTTHIMLTSKSQENACEEIELTNQKIFEITGMRPAYIRPPFGSWSEQLECIIPMDVILWNIDPLDWKIQNKEQIVSHVVKHAKNGSIILLHDSYKTSVEAALEIIDTLTREGYTFVTAEELLVD